MGIRYVVDIDLVVSGDINAKLAPTERKTKELAGEFGKIGKSFLDGFTGAVEAVGAKVAALGAVAGAAGVAAVTYGVAKLNNELEGAQVSLAAVLNASLGGGMEQSMGEAAGWLAQMREDAKELPGEFSDLMGIVQSGASSAFNAGLDVQGFEELAKYTMAAAKASQVEISQAGRELAHLLEGRAGSDNVLGARLGIHAEGFNDKDAAERLKILQTALGKFQPAIEVFGNTMDAQSSTLIDNAKTFLAAATGPLFGRIKDTLEDANNWFKSNQATLKYYSDRVSNVLVDAFDRGKAVVLEYGPLLLDFAGKAYEKIVRIWQDAEPYVKSIGAEIKEFLKDDSSFDKIGTVLKLYIAAKGTGGALSIGGSVASTIGTLRNLGLFGGGAGGAGAAGSGIFSGIGGQAAAAVGGIGSAGALAGGVIAAAVAAIGATLYEVYDRQNRSRTVDHEGGSSFGRSDKEKKYVDDLTERGLAAGRAMGDMTDSAMQVPDGFSAATDAAHEFAFVLKSLAKSGDFDKIAKINETLDAEAERAAARYKTTAVANDEGGWDQVKTNLYQLSVGFNSFNMAVDQQKQKELEAARKKKAVEGKGGTTIHKVEITVSSNQAPGQIARDVVRRLDDLKRNPTASPGVRNFSAGAAFSSATR